jgi:conjugative relaxase-like TrwC/TraI family protein
VVLFIILSDRTPYHFDPEKYIHKMMWFGKIAERLGLKTQEVDVEDFSDLSEGLFPKSKKDVTKKGSCGTRRLGIEIIIMKPKSLSIFYLFILVHNSKIAMILEEIDESALKSLLLFIETEHAFARINKDGQRIYIKTQSALICNFSHIFNANLEPHWHWHAHLFPFTNCDNNYMALQNRRVIDSQVLYGLLYRSELIKCLVTEGFRVRITDNEMGFFQLDEVSEEIINLFSSRSDEIEENKREFETKYPNASKHTISHLAKFKNRQKQSEKDVSKIIKSNVEKLESAGFTIENLSGLRLKKKIVAPINLAQIIYEIYQKEGEKLFEFSKERILKDIALAVIVQGTGALIEEICTPFQGGDYVEVIKKMIHQQIQTIERKQHVGRNRQRIIEKYTAGVFKLSNRAYKNARRAHEYFDEYCQNFNISVGITIDERLFTLCGGKNGESREAFRSYPGTKTIGEVLLFHRVDEVDFSHDVEQSDIARKPN